jgi:hypothetical protein
MLIGQATILENTLKTRRLRTTWGFMLLGLDQQTSVT